MNGNELPPCAGVSGKIIAARRVLLMTHCRPDGDALGSTFGMRAFLRHNGIDAEVLLPDGMPRRYRGLCLGALPRLLPGEADGFDLFLALDCANPERLGCGDQLTVETLRAGNFICIDHHRGNCLDAPDSWVDPAAGSTCQMVMELIDFLNLPLPPEGATMLLTGMMTDTGCFCFSNTTGRSFRAAALAADYGADIERIANAVFFSKPMNQLNFEAEMVGKCLRIACGGKLAYACLPDELMAKYDFELREDEGLIDILRGLEGVVIAMLVHRRPDGWRVSLRSKDSRFPVAPTARQFGGGGHDLAAGCTIDVPEFAQVEATLIPLFDRLLEERP